MANAGPLLLGAGALALYASQKKAATKPRFGLLVNRHCRVELIDGDKYKAFLRGGYLEEIADNPGAGPFELASALFADVAPHCHHFPEDSETIDIYRLYLNILGHVSNFLVDDGKLKPKQVLELREDSEFAKWSIENMERLSPMWGAIPEDHVGFAKDHSEYRIGPDWEEETLAPFVIEGKEAGKTGQQIYDSFVTKKYALVGEHKFIRISELPQNEPAVQEFQEWIIKGIEAAG